MMQNLMVSYTVGSVDVSLKVDTSPDSNLPFSLSELFARIIKESMAKPEMVIEDLKTMIEDD